MQVNTRLIAAALLGFALGGCQSGNSGTAIDPLTIAKASGLQGAYDETAHVFRVEITRPDLEVTVQGTKIPAGMGLNSWISFTGTKTHTVLIGEVRLLETEVNDFLKSALATGIEITNVHNTFLGDQPRVMSVHFEAIGGEEALAKEAGVLLGSLPAARGSSGALPAGALLKSLNVETIQRYLWKGEWTGGAYRVVTGRGTELSGVPIGKAMGVESWAAFAGSDEHAVVNGDIAVLETELEKVLKSLIDSNIQIISIHTHLIQEVPRVLFVHFWGTGKLESLVLGVKGALRTEKTFRGSQ